MSQSAHSHAAAPTGSGRDFPVSRLGPEDVRRAASGRPARGPDRSAGRPAAGRRLCDDRRHAAPIRALRQHRADHNRRAVRLLVASGRRAEHDCVARSVRVAERVRADGHAALRGACDNARRDGGRHGARPGFFPPRRAGQLHFAHGRGRLHGRRRHSHHDDAIAQFLRAAHPPHQRVLGGAQRQRARAADGVAGGHAGRVRDASRRRRRAEPQVQGSRT